MRKELSLLCGLLSACGSSGATTQDASVSDAGDAGEAGNGSDASGDASLDANPRDATGEAGEAGEAGAVDATGPCLDGMMCQGVSIDGVLDVSCQCQAAQWQCPLWPPMMPGPGAVLPSGDPSTGSLTCPAALGDPALTNLACALPDRCGTLCVCEGSVANWACGTMAVDDAGQPVVVGGIVQLSDAGPPLSPDGGCPWPACALSAADGGAQPCTDAGPACITVTCHPQLCGVPGLAFFPFACMTQ